MKRYICRSVFIIVIFAFLLLYINPVKYDNYQNPWFNISELNKYIIAFLLLVLNSYCYKKINNKYIFWFYINMLLVVFYFIIDIIEINLLILFLSVLISALIVNTLYRENKLSGYLSIPYLFFITYVLVINQTIALIN